MIVTDFMVERERLKEKITEYNNALKKIEREFVAEHRQLTDPCWVAHDGWPYRFTGDVYVDGTGSLQYELRSSGGCLSYAQFEDLEVIQ